MIRRFVVAILFAALLVVGLASRVDAGARRYCINWAPTSSSAPIKICLPIIYDQ